MTRRLRVDWPTDLGSASSNQTVRILAVSDEVDKALENQVNRDALGRIDLIVGCGDLDPAYLAMVGDAFRVPLLYVRGNHDRGANWQAHVRFLPEPLPDGHTETAAGIEFIGLSWPGRRAGHADHDELAAWRQVLGTGVRATFNGGPRLVISHAPPLEAGDDPADPYHRGFRAYRWLAMRLRPTLWLHGHTTVATSQSLTTQLGPTTIVNVTGAALIDLVPLSSGGAAARSGPAGANLGDTARTEPATTDAPHSDVSGAMPAPAEPVQSTAPSSEGAPAEPEGVASAGPRQGA
jgi:uncharacterized protein